MKHLLLFFILLTAFVPLTSNAQINVQTQTIRSDVELIWEAHTYVPPLYRGKALYPIGGEVTVFAIPPSDLGNPSTLTYTWKKNSEVQGGVSGVGRRSYTFSGSQFGDSPLIVVEVSNGATSVFGALRLVQTSPVLRLYENHPLAGIMLEHALPRTITTQEKAFGVEAYPYFFSARSRSDIGLSYTWSANGQKVAGALGGSISIQSEEPHSASLQLSIHHITEILQRQSEGLTIVFE